MDVGSILIGLALAILVGAFIARPITERSFRVMRVSDRELSSMQAEQDRILSLIEELEMDHAIGKILDDDYQAQRTWLMQQGAENLKRIDALLVRSTPHESDRPMNRSLEEELEASVKQLRAGKQQEGQRFCGSCGARIVPGDRFCVECGVDLSMQEVGG